MSVEFEWDEGNLRHILQDHPERENTVVEIESIFTDPYFEVVFDRLDPNTQEPRYCGVGRGTSGKEKYVVFVVRNGKFRPITCRRAQAKQRKAYYEIVNSTSSQKTGGN